MTVSEFLKENPNIIVDPGMNWCTVHCLTEEQKDKFIELYKAGNPAPRYAVMPQTGLIGIHISSIARLRNWFSGNPGIGRQEKAYAIEQLKRYQETGEHSGISPSAYPELIEKLEKLPDCDDIEGYCIHYHY